MPTAPHIAGLPSQSPQGVGARLVRRLGGAVRSVIVRGITLAGTLRRPPVPQTDRDHTTAQDPQAPAPTPLPVSRPPRPALPAPLLPPPLLAHLLAARRHRRLAATSRPAFLNQGDKPFTPEAFPQLSPKACAILNTPLKDCDPKTLELVFSTFASHINQLMSPEAGITDLAAAFPNLLHRLDAALADTNSDACLSTTAEAGPAAMPDAPVVPPQPPAQAPTTGPTTPSVKDAPRLSPLPLSDPTASDPPTDATITTAAPRTPPDTAAPSRPVVHRSRPFRHRTQSSTRWRRRNSQPNLPRRIRVYLRASMVLFSCYHYAACTGPP